MREQQSLFGATEVLIEDKASGTQLIQELIIDGCHGVTRYQPTGDKTMRLHAQTALIENGFVQIPETAAWLAEYLHELTVFPKGKHDDQADSTAQFLDWFKTPMQNWAFYELTRQRVQELEQRRKPPPVKTVFAPGSMEWLAEQEKARSTAAPDPVSHTLPDVREAEKLDPERFPNPERFRVRLAVPPGIGSLQTFSGRHINVGPDRTVEMSADDAQYLIRDGWTKLAEWASDEAA